MSKRIDALRKRLLQVDADVAAGRVSAADAAQAKARLEREVLDAVLHGKAPAAAPPATAAPAPAAHAAPAASDAADPWSAARPSRRLVAAVSAFVLLFALAGYAWRGDRAGWSVAPGMSGGPAGAHAAPGIDAGQLDEMVGKLAQRLQRDPDDAQGWSLLGRSYAVLGRHADSAAAMKRALDLQPDNAQALVDYADALGMANGGTLEGEPERLIAKALAIDGNHPEALALAGTIAFRKADYAQALRHWEKVVAQAEPQSELATQLQGGIDEARRRAGLGGASSAAAATSAPATTGTATASSAAAKGATASLPPAVAGQSAGAGAGAGAGAAAAAGAGVVGGRVTLSAALRDQAAPDDTLFVFARAAEGSRMPLAILRKQVKDLPLQFQLDDSMAMTPAARLSGAARVVVGARISKRGGATPQPGDLQGLSAAVAPGSAEAAALAIEISQPVR